MAKPKDEWMRTAYPKAADRLPAYSTLSDMDVDPLYTPDDLADWSYEKKLGHPGEYPFTRGAYPSMYRGKLWTMRQFAGFGTAEDTNERFKFLLAQGQTGLSTAFDMPTLMGYDADHPRALGEVGREGVAVSSLADMEALFADIPLDQVTTSMTMNCSGEHALGDVLRGRGAPGIALDKVGGHLQNDMLKEFIAQKEWISPPAPSVRIIVDMIEFCAQHGAAVEHDLDFRLPHPRSRLDGRAGARVHVGRRHRLRAGGRRPRSRRRQLRAAAFLLLQRAQRLLRGDRQVPRGAPHVGEDHARALRGQRPEVRGCCARTRRPPACSLTAQQPLNNIVRVTMQAFAAVFGGTQSLHTNSMDETLALPTEEAALVALRTQQIIAEETGVANMVDPLGGSYAIETLTDRLERDACAYIQRIDELGGIIRAIELGYPQQEISEAAYRYQRELDRGEKVMVGVNKYQLEEGPPLELLRISADVEREQVQRVRERKQARNRTTVARALANVQEAASNGANLMPPIIAAVEEECTVGEIADVFRSVFGVYRDPAWI